MQHDWSLPYTISYYIDKNVALLRPIYRGLTLLAQVLKVKERIVGKIIRTQVDTDAVTFGFMPWAGDFRCHLYPLKGS